MSAFESMVWTLLGYAAMPTIFIVGFLMTVVVTCFLLDITGNAPDN